MSGCCSDASSSRLKRYPETTHSQQQELQPVSIPVTFFVLYQFSKSPVSYLP